MRSTRSGDALVRQFYRDRDLEIPEKYLPIEEPEDC